jgi:hypothetical protein
MVCTRPDISFVVSKLSQFCDKPTTEHWVAVKHVFRYLKETIDYCLHFCKDVQNLSLIGYCDADWAGAKDRKSTSGYCFKLNKCSSVVSWKSKKQCSVALSTCEAEYVAITMAIKEALFLKQLLSDVMGCACVTLYCDNQGSISLTKNPIVSQRTKHIDIRYHFIRDVLLQGLVCLEYVQSADNIADLFTKPMTKVKLNQFMKELFG